MSFFDVADIFKQQQYLLYGGNVPQNILDLNGNDYEKNRIIELNNSYYEKRQYYRKIIVAVIIAVLIYIVLLLISKYTSFLPSAVTDILFILIFTFTLIYCVRVLIQIYRRHNLHFGLLNQKPPATTNSGSASITIQPGGDLLASSAGNRCVGQNCCTIDSTFWDPGTSRCIPKHNTSSSATKEAYLYTDFVTEFSSSCSNKDLCGYSCVEPGTPCALSKADSINLPPPNL